MSQTASLLRRWRRRFLRVFEHQIEPLNHHVNVFGAFQESVNDSGVRRNSATGALANWMAFNFLVFASTWVRKATEEPPKRGPAKKRQSVSLLTLLREIEGNVPVFTFEYFRRKFIRRGIPLRLIRAQWERNFGTNDQLGVRQVRTDIREVKQATSRLRAFVNKQVAHTEWDRRTYVSISFGEIKAATEVLTKLFYKYHLLTCGKHIHFADEHDDLDEMRALLSTLWGAR